MRDSRLKASQQFFERSFARISLIPPRFRPRLHTPAKRGAPPRPLPSSLELKRPQNTMATKAQIRANRANALRSTGPRTPRGKARSALNGLQHGLRSHLPIPETPELQALRAAFQDEWRPNSHTACALVEVLSVSAWRFKYITRIMEPVYRHPDPRFIACRMFTLTRYLGEASRLFLRALAALDALAADPSLLHDQTQFQAKSFNINELRQRCRAGLKRTFHTKPFPSLKRLPGRPTPHFPAHRCRAGPP